jgi:SET domain-containing protein
MQKSVKVVLRPSAIQGIGIFAVTKIRKGEEVRIWDGSDLCFFKKPPKGKLFHAFKHYCIETKGGYLGPKDFARMSIGWYINHSDKPNLQERLVNKEWHYYATRTIQKGEEITMDYRTLDSDYDNLP